MLAKAFEKGNRPFDRTYRTLYPKLPAALQRRLPVPDDHANYKTRLGAAALLDSLGSDARPALPVLTRALRCELQEGVRLELLACFIRLAKDMNPKEKEELLPELLRAMRDNSYSIRNNAAMVLKFYPEQAGVVVPVLVMRALHDPRPEVRLQAAAALDGVDHQAARQAEVVAAVLALTTNEHSYVAIQAQRLLSEIEAEPTTKAGVR
jgi:HEAT repeat protein